MPLYSNQRSQTHTFRYWNSALAWGLAISYSLILSCSLALPSYALVKSKNKQKDAVTVGKRLSVKPLQKIASSGTGSLPAEPHHPIVHQVDPAIDASLNAPPNPPLANNPTRT